MPASEKGRARDKAAAMVGASPRYVQDAKQIAQDAPEILDEVIQGRLSIPQAKRVVALPANRAQSIQAVIDRINHREGVL